MLLLVAGFLLHPVHARAQPEVDIAISSAPSPVGAGARALGVGSAFIALADDATAASWNPAGLIQLERPEISAVGLGRIVVDDVGTLDTSSGDRLQTKVVGTDSQSAMYVNYLSGAFPFSWRGINLIASLNYQQQLSFERDLDLATTTLQPLGTDFVTRRAEQSGAVYSLSPAAAIELTPELSLGASISYWFDGLGRAHAWQVREYQAFDVQTAVGPIAFEATGTSTYSNFRGVNATFGTLWKHRDGLSLGAFVELPFTARFTLLSDNTQFERAARRELSMRLPTSFGAGISYRLSDLTVLSLDATHVLWSDFRIRDETGAELLVSGDPANDSRFVRPDDPPGGYSVDDVTTVRLGGEHLVRAGPGLVALRAGAFYDPEPSRGAPEDFWGVSAGLGYAMEELSFDFAYQFRFGLDVRNIAVLRTVLEAESSSMDIYQHAFYLSAIYYF